MACVTFLWQQGRDVVRDTLPSTYSAAASPSIMQAASAVKKGHQTRPPHKHPGIAGFGAASLHVSMMASQRNTRRFQRAPR